MKNEVFLVYKRGARKGKPGYSEKDYSAPHKEGGKVIEGVNNPPLIEAGACKSPY